MGIFVDDDPEMEVMREDLAWPFTLTGTGDLAGVSGVANLETALIGRAITRRGEIGHRPQYGVDFDEYQNAPSTDDERVSLEALLLEQYQREPRLDSIDVDVFEDPDSEGDTIVRVNGVAKTGQQATAEVPFFQKAE